MGNTARGLIAAFIAVFPSITVITFTTIYLAGGVLLYVAAALGTSIATMLAIPVIGSFISPAFARKAGAQWAKLGSIYGFAPGQPKAIPFYAGEKGWLGGDQGAQGSMGGVEGGEGVCLFQRPLHPPGLHRGLD